MTNTIADAVLARLSWLIEQVGFEVEDSSAIVKDGMGSIKYPAICVGLYGDRYFKVVIADDKLYVIPGPDPANHYKYFKAMTVLLSEPDFEDRVFQFFVTAMRY